MVLKVLKNLRYCRYQITVTTNIFRYWRKLIQKKYIYTKHWEYKVRVLIFEKMISKKFKLALFGESRFKTSTNVLHIHIWLNWKLKTSDTWLIHNKRFTETNVTNLCHLLFSITRRFMKYKQWLAEAFILKLVSGTCGARDSRMPTMPS